MTRRRRSRSFLSSVTGFFKDHWKILVGVIIAIIVIVIISKGGLQKFINRNQIPGEIGIVKIDGSKIGVFDTEDEATQNAITSDAVIRSIKVSGRGNIDVSANDGLLNSLITKTGKKEFDLDLSSVGDQETILATVMIGGDGSLIGKMLKKDMDVYYFAVTVNNPNPTATTTPVSPTDATEKVYFGDQNLQLDAYSSDMEAHTAVSQSGYTLPSDMLYDLTIKVEPSEGTARVFIMVCIVDGNEINSEEICLEPGNNWTEQLDLSEYAGSQITLMVHSEDGSASNHKYEYFSFFVPQK